MVRPYEQPLEREVNHEAEREADGQSRLERDADDFGEHGGRAQVDERHRASRQRETHALPEQARLRGPQPTHQGARAVYSGRLSISSWPHDGNGRGPRSLHLAPSSPRKEGIGFRQSGRSPDLVEALARLIATQA